MKHERYYYTKRCIRRRQLSGLCARCGKDKESPMWYCQVCRDELRIQRQGKKQDLQDLWKSIE